jgi:hypothetical protein
MKIKRPSNDEGVYLRRTPEGFVFASEYDKELGSRFTIGAIVRADIHQPRSGKHNRWYRALLRLVWQNQDHFASPEVLHKLLKYRLGEYDLIALQNGDTIIDFHSTSYDAMDEGQFTEFVHRSFDVIAKDIIPGLDNGGRKQLASAVDDLLRGSGTRTNLITPRSRGGANNRS